MRIHKGTSSTNNMVSEEAGEAVFQALGNLLVAHVKTVVRPAVHLLLLPIRQLVKDSMPELVDD